MVGHVTKNNNSENFIYKNCKMKVKIVKRKKEETKNSKERRRRNFVLYSNITYKMNILEKRKCKLNCQKKIKVKIFDKI